MDNCQTLRPAHCQSTRALKQNMRKKNCNTRKNIKRFNNILVLHNTDSSKTTFMQGVNISKEEMVTAVQPMRSLPNILRNSNTRPYRNYKAPALNKGDSSPEDINMSIDLNITLSSVDSEKEGRYDKTVSPRSHHQRKQVHNPLDAQYDIPDWNNNKDNVLQIADRKDMLYVSQRHEEDTLTKKSTLNNKCKSYGHKSLFNKKSKQILVSKIGNGAKESDEKLNTELTVALDRNMINDITGQNANNLFNNDTFSQTISESNVSSYMNNIGTKSDEFSNISYYNNNTYNPGKNFDINFNTVISGKSTEINTMQHKTFPKDRPCCNTLKTEDGHEEDLVNRDITPNFLFASNVLRSCACKNCTFSCDKDVILYEDPVSSCLSSDAEADMSTPYTYDFYTSDYYHILGDNWLEDFNKQNFYFEEIGETNVTKENASADSVNIKLINSNANTSMSVSQNESQNSQTSHIDRIQDICAQPYPTELDTYPNESTKSSKSIEHIKILDETGYLNLESVSMDESAIPRNEASLGTVISANVPVSKSKHQQYEEKATDASVIQCTQCRRLFNEKHQFIKHFTHCSFSREDFKCSVCHRIYRYKSSLVHHLKTVHHKSHNPHGKSYTCYKCKKLYVRFRAYQRHLLLHDED